jgi:hypothetical protein
MDQTRLTVVPTTLEETPPGAPGTAEAETAAGKARGLIAGQLSRAARKMPNVESCLVAVRQLHGTDSPASESAGSDEEFPGRSDEGLVSDGFGLHAVRTAHAARKQAIFRFTEPPDNLVCVALCRSM